MRQPDNDPRSWWRAALAGEKPAIDMNSPQVGFYRRRLVRLGPWVGCCIYLHQEVDAETGELTDDAVLCCDVNGKPADPEDQWSYLASQPITEKEFQFLTKLSRYAKKKKDPAEPLANPRKPIDPLQFRLPTFNKPKGKTKP